jgi:hypothetical protein
VSILRDQILIELAFEGIKFDENFDILKFRVDELPHNVYFKTIIVNGAREQAGRRVHGNMSKGVVSDINDEDLKHVIEGFEHHYHNLMQEERFIHKDLIVIGLTHFTIFKEEWFL